MAEVQERTRLQVSVEKPTPYTFDLGYLMAIDPNPLELKSANIEDDLAATARDGAQALINQLLGTCPITSTPSGVLLSLPAPNTHLPREKVRQTDLSLFEAQSLIHCSHFHHQRPRLHGSASLARRASRPRPRISAKRCSTTRRLASGCQSGDTRAPTRALRTTGLSRLTQRRRLSARRAQLCRATAGERERREPRETRGCRERTRGRKGSLDLRPGSKLRTWDTGRWCESGSFVSALFGVWDKLWRWLCWDGRLYRNPKGIPIIDFQSYEMSLSTPLMDRNTVEAAM